MNDTKRNRLNNLRNKSWAILGLKGTKFFMCLSIKTLWYRHSSDEIFSGINNKQDIRMIGFLNLHPVCIFIYIYMYSLLFTIQQILISSLALPAGFPVLWNWWEFSKCWTAFNNNLAVTYMYDFVSARNVHVRATRVAFDWNRFCDRFTSFIVHW